MNDEAINSVRLFYQRREARLRQRLAEAEDLIEKYQILKAIHSNQISEMDFGREDGGPGSGNFGHKGVKGQLGGSAPSEKPVAFNTEGKKKTEITKDTIDKCKQGSVVVTSNGLQFVKVERKGKLVWRTPSGMERDDLDSAVTMAKANPSSIALYEGDGSEPDLYMPNPEGKAPGEVTPDSKTEMPKGHKYGGHDVSKPDQSVGNKMSTRVKENMGCDVETAIETLYAMSDYSGLFCGAIKQASETGRGPKKYVEAAKYLDKYCEEAPTWNGGALYRGEATSPLRIAELKQACETGKEVEMHGISSWSSDKGTAIGFGKEGAVFVCESGTTWGSSIKHFSEYEKEDEVLVSSKARYKIKDYSTKDGVVYFNVIENNPRVQDSSSDK